MLNLLLTILIILAAYYYYKKKQSQNNNPSQPIHYDLLDSNSNPIPSSRNGVQPSANPTPSRVSDGETVGKDAQTQQLQHFCVKDKGHHASVWPKVQGIQGIDYLEFSIAGITHGEHVNEHLGEFIAALVADPTNPYDLNAIKIITREGHRIGYVPRNTTTDIHSFTTLPCACYCYIGINNNTYYTDCYIIKM